MSTLPDLAGPLGAALAEARARAASAIAADLPDDVALALDGDGMAITGRALSPRAATDPRLRDFAAIVRAAR